MAVNNKTNNEFRYERAEKTNKNFMYKDLRKANCYHCNFSGSNFNFASFRGAHFKSCDFFGATFESAEFIATNLKKSKFKKAKFENAIFEGVTLDGADFSGAEFKNVIFVGTDISKAVNLKFNEEEVKIFDDMPEIEIGENLKNAVSIAMENEYVKRSRLLDTKDGGINTLSIMRLLENFKEKTLVDGLKILGDRLDKDICTLSYIVKALNKYREEGLI